MGRCRHGGCSLVTQLAATTTICPQCHRPLPGRAVAAHPPPPPPPSSSSSSSSVAGPAHRSCIALLEITDACNLACAACYASSPAGAHRSVDELVERVARFIEGRNGELDILQLSG